MGARATGVVALAWAVTAGVAAPEPPLWPDRFHVMSAQTTPGGKDVVHLFYDWPGGRNLNVITGQALERAGKGTLWDFERQDGLTFYYTPRTRECRTIDMKYGLLPPTWLRDKPAAELVGQGVTVGPFRCNVWTKGESDTPGVPFITYYAEEQTDRPVRWAFYSARSPPAARGRHAARSLTGRHPRHALAACPPLSRPPNPTSQRARS